MITHEASSQPGLPTLRDISADTMKMPEPIIDPATSMVESNSPRVRVRSLFAACMGLLSSIARAARAQFSKPRCQPSFALSYQVMAAHPIFGVLFSILPSTNAQGPSPNRSMRSAIQDCAFRGSASITGVPAKHRHARAEVRVFLFDRSAQRIRLPEARDRGFQIAHRDHHVA